jgi:hypothetical protein
MLFAAIATSQPRSQSEWQMSDRHVRQGVDGSMKEVRGVLFIAVAFCSFYSLSHAQETHKGPFGFCFGETKQDVIAAVGDKAVLEDVDDTLRLSKAPQPFAGIRSYLLLFSPKKGLLKIQASSGFLDVNDSGDQLKEEFHRIESALISVYGTPTKQYDLLRKDSELNKSNEWMASLLYEDRILVSFWQGSFPDHVSAIKVDATALNVSSGYISFEYEFEGFDEYVEENKLRENIAPWFPMRD